MSDGNAGALFIGSANLLLHEEHKSVVTLVENGVVGHYTHARTDADFAVGPYSHLSITR